MKVFFLLLMAMPAMSFAQKITLDYTNSDSVRTIKTDVHEVQSSLIKTIDFSIGLQADVAKDGSTVYTLDCILKTRNELLLGVGKKLMFKTEKGDIVILENIKDIKNQDIERVHDIIDPSKIINSCFPAYRISKSDLKKLIDDGIVKIRVETNGFVMDGKVTNFTEKLKTMYNLVERQKSISSSKPMVDDF